MHPIQDLFLESFSYELQFDMHSYLHKKFYSCKKWVLQPLTFGAFKAAEDANAMQIDAGDPAKTVQIGSSLDPK
jgi:hypothetical protein